MTFPFRDVLAAEHRDGTEGRPYDDRDASHLWHPNGTLIASFDRAFLAAATAEVLAAHGALQPKEVAA